MTSVTSRKRRRATVVSSSGAPAPQRVAFYYRVSTDEQAEQRTVEAQRDYLHSHYRLDFSGEGPMPMQFIAEYSDEGWSGATPLVERPGGVRLLQDAKAGRFDVVIVYKVDRLGRSARVLLDAHDQLAELNVALTSATEPFDTRPGPMQAIGKFIFQLLGSIAELERSTIAMRTMNGKLRVAKDGDFVNGVVPVGYTVDEHDKLVPNRATVPELGISEANMVTEIFQRVADCETCYAVADWLADAGVSSPRRWFNKEHHRLVEADVAAPWSNRRVWETIRNDVYRGTRTLNFDDRQHEQSVPPLVTEHVWNAANEKMKRNNSWSGERSSFVYLLRQKLRCDLPLPSGESCGRFYTGGMANKYPYYKCNGNTPLAGRQRGARCGARLMPVKYVESLVWDDLVWQVHHSEEALARTQETLRQREERSVEQESRRTELAQQRDRLVLTRQHLRRLGSRGLGADGRSRPFEEIEDDLAENQRAINAINNQLAGLEAALEVTGAMERQLRDGVLLMAELKSEIDDVTASGDRETMREILERLVREIRVLDGTSRTPRFEVYWRFRPDPTSSVREFVNIQTVVVQGVAPAEAPRRIAAE